MSKSLFKLGGEFDIQRKSNHQYEMKIPLPSDETGQTGRECPEDSCSPAAFKIKFGTGIQTEQADSFCPYCRHTADQSDFMTEEQGRFAKEVMMREAHDGIMRDVSEALGMGRNRKRTFGGGMFNIEMSLDTSPKPTVRRPREELLRRDITCPNCTLEHAVYGLAVWCPDCGVDIFLTHVETEYDVVRKMLSDVERRNENLGARVAARDIENCLEDVVSISEAALKAMTKRKLLDENGSPEETEQTMKKKVRNRFQSIEGTNDILNKLFGFDLSCVMPASEIERLTHTIEKRHPITHNLGIVDRKYLDKVRSAEHEGRDINLDEQEIESAMNSMIQIIQHVHQRLFQH